MGARVREYAAVEEAANLGRLGGFEGRPNLILSLEIVDPLESKPVAI
jgi:hypothetical protein